MAFEVFLLFLLVTQACETSLECLQVDNSLPVCIAGQCSVCITNDHCSELNRTCYSGSCKTAFIHPVSLTVAGVSGAFLLLLFLCAFVIWRLYERADKAKEVKEDYNKSMRAVRGGIDQLLKKAEMTKQKTRLEDQASEGLLVWSDTEEESSSAPLLDFTGLRNDYEFSDTSDSVVSEKTPEGTPPTSSSASTTSTSISESSEDTLEASSSSSDELPAIAYNGYKEALPSDTESSSENNGSSSNSTSSSSQENQEDSTSSSIDPTQMLSI